MSALRDYARSYADAMESFNDGRVALAYRLLAEHGEDNVFTPLPEGEEYGYAKQCYANSIHRVLLGDFRDDATKLTYYEGLADATGVFPHAWVQDDEGRVYDLTLRHNDPRCAFCNGEGEIHPTDHWDYYAPNDGDEEEWDDENVECEMCDGTGNGNRISRDDVAYLGIPVPFEHLRRAVQELDVYGVLFNDPERVEAMLKDSRPAGERAA